MNEQLPKYILFLPRGRAWHIATKDENHTLCGISVTRPHRITIYRNHLYNVCAKCARAEP